jgi:hypothetical protein
MRTCVRSGCNSPAAAILTYDREAQTAYLYAVDDPSTRTPGDLCDRHVGRLVLPRSWQLDDRRERAVEPEPAPAEVAPPKAKRPKKLRAVPTAAPRTAAPRRPSRQKWAAVGSSLFDAAASEGGATRGGVAAPVAAGVSDVSDTSDDAATTEPVWMPRFGPDSELEGVLDAKTPLLRRAFGGR